MVATHAHSTNKAGVGAPAPARLMCIATHHKGGTIWIKRTIMALSRAISVPWIGIWSANNLDRVPGNGRAFLCNWAGSFPPALWSSPETAFLHVIRDPRDILLSGCAYHQTAGVKGERFLHVARDDLDGRTYQEHLNALDSTTDKLLFEMANKHAETIREMRAWPYDDRRSIDLRYEDLMSDTNCSAIRQALATLGLQSDEVDRGVQAFWDNSLFGGLADASARKGRLKTHVASGGQLRRWERELPRSVGRAYADRYGDDLIALGYEHNNTWVDQLAA